MQISISGKWFKFSPPPPQKKKRVRSLKACNSDQYAQYGVFKCFITGYGFNSNKMSGFF